MKFFDRLNESIALNQSILCVSLEPDPDLWPQQLGTWDVARSNLRGVQEWLQLAIAETADLVCAYKLKLEFYRSLGSPGLELLQKTLAIVPAHIPIILDAQHADPQTSTIFALGCIQFGEYVQSSGATFPYYIDLRTIISHPQVFEQVLSAYAEVLQTLTFDRIAGIPFGSLPTATGLGLRLNYPMLFPRKELKAHGTRRIVEGQFQPGETVVVVDDILITGKSVMEGAEKLKSAGLKVEDIVVLIDHEGGVKAKLQQNGYRGHAVLTISEIAATLYEAGRLNTEQFQSFGLPETNNEYQY
jgi:orotate phosphoribosyltransferase